jgi:hypothetical protein
MVRLKGLDTFNVHIMSNMQIFYIYQVSSWVKCSINRKKNAECKKRKTCPIQGCTPLSLSMFFLMKLFNNNFFMVYKH